MLGLDQAKLSSVKSTAFRLTYSTGSTGIGTVLLLSWTVAGSASTVAGSSSTGAGASSSSETASTIGSGGTGGRTGGRISGGTIGGLEQIELIVRPSENPRSHRPGRDWGSEWEEQQQGG